MKAKKLLCSILAVCMILSTMSFVAFAEEAAQSTGSVQGLAGSGTEDDPFVITNADELAWLREIINAKRAEAGIEKYAKDQYFVLGADIDLGGAAWEPIYAFYGVLDGNNYTISNFTCDTAIGNGGLTQFMYGTIKNLTVSDVTATVGASKIFAPIASTFKGTLDKVYTRNINVTISAPGTADNAPSMVGGMIAWDGNQSSGHDGTVKNCSVENLNVTAADGKNISVGGFVNVICRNLAADSYDNNTVSGVHVVVSDTDAGCQIGGFVAQTETGWNVVALNNCHVSGIDFTVSGTGVMIGGFIANPGAHTTITNSTSEGDIDAGNVTEGKVGGFTADLGWNNNLGGKGDHQFIDCAADVEITTGGAVAGGFIGSTYSEGTDDMDVLFYNCSATNDVTTTLSEGGFAGYADRGTFFKCGAIEPFFGEDTGATVYANGLSVEFALAEDNDDEGYMIYDIKIIGENNEIINRLNTADLTFAMSSDKVAYVITPSNKITLTTDADYADRYMFNFTGKDNVDDTKNEIVIGQVQFTGYDAFTFGVAAADTNLVTATTLRDNIVDEFKTSNGTLVVNTDVVEGDENIGVIDTKIEVPVRTLTVNVAFPNVVYENKVDDQAMTVKVTGTNYETVIDLDDVAMVNGGYTVEIDDLVLNNTYNVEVSGAGYRTAYYTVTMTEAKTLNFWNNVKDENTVVEVGEDASAVKVTYLAGDIVKDNIINIYDLSAVVSYFAEATSANENYIKYDLNRDGVIDSKDVAYVLVSWGK